MRSILVLCCLFVSGISGIVVWAQDCTTFNRVFGPFPYAQTGYADHSTGNHTFANEMTGHCTYTGYSACDAVASAGSASAVTDTGTLTLPGYVHESAQTDASGTSTASYPANAVASAEGVGAVRECLVGCSFGITLSGPGGTINFTGGAPKWQAKNTYTNTCVARTVAVGSGDGGGGGGCGGAAGMCPCSTCVEPLLIDTTGQGFHLTDPDKSDGYVTFNFGGKLRKVSWPDFRYENAWLVYDQKGVIDGADDLFGNFTPHADGGVTNHPDPNGLLALAWYDRPAQGGNLDGRINHKDAIWSKLRLWKPKHCHEHPDQACVALDSELYTLDQLGIQSINLVYTDGSDLSVVFPEKIADVCKFKAVVNLRKSLAMRWACDFYLAERK